MKRKDIFDKIDMERFRQDEIYGHSWKNYTIERWSNILFAECGEVASAINDLRNHRGDINHIKEEILQVAAFAVKWLEKFDYCENCQLK